MKLTIVLALALAFTWAFAFAGGVPKTTKEKLIDRLDQFVQQRFAAPPDRNLGMSRVATPSSFNRHFQPTAGALTDFRPETTTEYELLRELDSAKVKVGFFVFGAAIEKSTPQALDFRALKGPAAVTAVTNRPMWYPGYGSRLLPEVVPDPLRLGKLEVLPDWKQAYFVARQAMFTFERGGKVPDSMLAEWHTVARPVPASSVACVGCHNNAAIGRSSHLLATGNALGGVLYVYR